MPTYFDHTDWVLCPLHKIVYGTTASSQFLHYSVTNTTDFEFYRGLFDPGHQNKADLLDYNFTFYGVSSLINYKWQIRGWGGAWTTLTSATGGTTSGASYTETVNGTYDTSQITMPCHIRLLISSTWTMTNTNFYTDSTGKGSGLLVMRAVGTIST